MNARRVHELMRQRFPEIDAATHDWINVMGSDGPIVERLKQLCDQHLSSPEVVVEVHRKVGALLVRSDALAYICAHIGQGQIRIADRQFTQFVVVAVNGVATGWQLTANSGVPNERCA